MHPILACAPALFDIPGRHICTIYCAVAPSNESRQRATCACCNTARVVAVISVGAFVEFAGGCAIERNMDAVCAKTATTASEALPQCPHHLAHPSLCMPRHTHSNEGYHDTSLDQRKPASTFASRSECTARRQLAREAVGGAVRPIRCTRPRAVAPTPRRLYSGAARHGPGAEAQRLHGAPRAPHCPTGRPGMSGGAICDAAVHQRLLTTSCCTDQAVGAESLEHHRSLRCAIALPQTAQVSSMHQTRSATCAHRRLHLQLEAQFYHPNRPQRRANVMHTHGVEHQEAVAQFPLQ